MTPNNLNRNTTPESPIGPSLEVEHLVLPLKEIGARENSTTLITEVTFLGVFGLRFTPAAVIFWGDKER